MPCKHGLRSEQESQPARKKASEKKVVFVYTKPTEKMLLKYMQVIQILSTYIYSGSRLLKSLICT